MDSTGSTSELMPWEPDEPFVQVFDAQGFPEGHSAEPGLFVRQLGVPGHDQEALERSKIVMVGAGGLGSWTGLGLVRSGAKNLTIIDPDRFDRTNAHRQLMFPEDLGRRKAAALAKNLVPHMIGGGTIRAFNQRFEDVIEVNELEADVLLVLVDNNRCRWEASRWARARRIPAVFAMLSLDGMRMQAFLQGPNPTDACLWCALPNLDPEARAPCADGVIASCMLAAAYSTLMAGVALGRAASVEAANNWLDVDLGRSAREGFVARRRGCPGHGPCFSRGSQTGGRPDRVSDDLVGAFGNR